MVQAKVALLLAVLSLTLSVGAAVHMAFWGASYAKVSVDTGEVIERESGRTGAFHPILIVLVLFPITGLIGIQKENLGLLRAAAIGMFLLAVLSLFGAGPLFLLASLLLISAALFYRKEES